MFANSIKTLSLYHKLMDFKILIGLPPTTPNNDSGDRGGPQITLHPHGPYGMFPPMQTLSHHIRKMFIGAVVAQGVLGFAVDARAGLEALRPSVVKIYVTVQREDFQQPWQGGQPGSGSGSGFIIPGKRILSNAHVVSDAKFIEVQREGNPAKYPATVAFISHECDLAVLTVEDPSFFTGTRPLPFGRALPGLNTEVIALGYPMGGDRLSLTRGVVSRLDFALYTHSTVDSHMVLQVDAAINPGNSGGPVLLGNKVIGVAFQGIAGAQSIGYAIPLPVIQRFLKDIDDGTYDGYTELGVSAQDTVNPALRADLGLDARQTGVTVSYIDPFGSAAGILQPRDVLLSIDGHIIDNEGLVKLDDATVEYAELVERKQCGETVGLTVWRDGKTQAIVIPLKRWNDPFIFRQTYDQRPEYTIIGGLVFSPLSRGYLVTLGNDLNSPAAQNLLYYSHYAKIDQLYRNREQFVILTGRLPHPVNTYCDGYVNQVLASVNGQAIGRIDDIPEALTKATNGFHIVRFEGNDNPLILDARLVAEADPDILARYSIPASSFFNKKVAP
jgi:S1-C subfamily serine protease